MQRCNAEWLVCTRYRAAKQPSKQGLEAPAQQRAHTAVGFDRVDDRRIIHKNATSTIELQFLRSQVVFTVAGISRAWISMLSCYDAGIRVVDRLGQG
jgi:hypothetical protein